MDEVFLLSNPGPVPVGDAVGGAIDTSMVVHRSPTFASGHERARNGLESVGR